MRAERERRDADGSRAEVATALRERLQAAEREMEVPAGLWERVQVRDVRVAHSNAPRTGARLAARLGDRVAAWSAGLRTTLIAVAAVAVAVVGCGTWWLLTPKTGSPPAHRPSDGASRTAPHRHHVPLVVHNIEKPCQKLRTMECGLRLAKNPYKPYAEPDNAAGHAWHGDKLAATCVVTDGQIVTDEHGLSSTRWYRVRTAHGHTGWLPGIRTRNKKEFPDCTAAERPGP